MEIWLAFGEHQAADYCVRSAPPSAGMYGGVWGLPVS